MKMDVKGKVAIITGASEGIGLATARRFASEGAKLVLVARSQEKLQALAQELATSDCEAIARPADMRDQKAVESMISETFAYFGRIDILINNAGQAAVGYVETVNVDDFLRIWELNVLGPLYAMQAAIPKMRAFGGLIINISSMVTKMHIPALAAYASTKCALNMLSETARVELEKDNIRVLTVFPRMTSTDFGKNSLGDQTIRQRQRSSHPAYTPDTADWVAGRILDAAQKEPAEQYMDA
jgi:short-subunit dehydrogenase